MPVNGESNQQARLTADQIASIKLALASGETLRAVARAHGLHRSTVKRLRKLWSEPNKVSDD